MNKIRVLIVDDSAFMRKAVRRMLSAAPDIEVVGAAGDGREAIEKAVELGPDVITMDVRMAGMDGLTALQHIMARRPTPVLMLSSLTREGAEITLKALDLGAVDFIDKARAESSMEITQLANELVAKVRTIAGVDVEKIGARRQAGAPAPAVPSAPRGRSRTIDVVALGTSTGGPPALQAVIPKLPADFPCPVLVVQHMPPGFTRSLADRLDGVSSLRVSEAVDGDVAAAGRVLVAPAGQHLRLQRKNGAYVVRLGAEPADAVHRPSVDVMMKSVAEACGSRSLGVILTGMGSDGATGMRAIKVAGGKTLAESEETCVVYGMPKSAVEEGVVDKIIPIHDMARAILHEV
jgi:two-component system chemotaxis response regulator CheB